MCCVFWVLVCSVFLACSFTPTVVMCSSSHLPCIFLVNSALLLVSSSAYQIPACPCVVCHLFSFQLSLCQVVSSLQPTLSCYAKLVLSVFPQNKNFLSPLLLPSVSTFGSTCYTTVTQRDGDRHGFLDNSNC